MQRKNGGSFAFFVTPPSDSSIPSISESMFSFKDGDVPYALTITLFGSMTIDECKMLSILLTQGYNFKLRVPRNFEHPGFHGAPLTLSLDEVIYYFECYVGKRKDLLPKAIVSMEHFFYYLRDKVQPQKSQKNPSPSH